MNDHQTMLSTAEEMVHWYQRALKGEFFRKPETLLEFKRIQAMADSLWHVVPADTLAYGKGGSIDWQDFHCFALSGQMDSWRAGDVLFHDQLDRPGGRRVMASGEAKAFGPRDEVLRKVLRPVAPVPVQPAMAGAA